MHNTCLATLQNRCHVTLQGTRYVELPSTCCIKLHDRSDVTLRRRIHVMLRHEIHVGPNINVTFSYEDIMLRHLSEYAPNESLNQVAEYVKCEGVTDARGRFNIKTRLRYAQRHQKRRVTSSSTKESNGELVSVSLVSLHV